MKKIILTFHLIYNLASFSQGIVLSEMKKIDGELIIILSGLQSEYMVKKGDTLESIAKKFNMKIEDLKKINNLKNNQDLKTDMILMVDLIEEENEKNTINIKYDY